MKMPAGVHRMSKTPKGNDVAGKVWWDADVILPDGAEVPGRFESRRGAFVYFTVGEQAYRAFVDRFQDEERSSAGHGIFDLREKPND